MYKVSLHYVIYSKERDDPHGNEATFALAEMAMELPFPPFIGLHIDSPHLAPKQSIKMVTWQTEGQYFICNLADDYPRHDLTYEDLKEVAAEMGWKVSEGLDEAKG